LIQASTSGPIDLSIITVITTPSEIEDLDRLLVSISDSDPCGQMETLVVSNGLSESLLEPLRIRHGWAQFLPADRNLGFAGANNWAMLKSKGRLVLLLNPDIRARHDALSKLVEFIDANPEIGGVTGKLVGDDGKPQVGFNVRGLPTFASVISESLLLHRFFPSLGVVRRYGMTDMDYGRAQRVEQPAGACLLVRRELIEQVGVMDESFFPIWYEDVDWCIRIRSYGWELWYLPEAVFDHLGAVSTRDWAKPAALKAKYRNLAYLCKKHFGVPMSIVMIIFMAAGMLIRSSLVLLGYVLRRDLSGVVKNLKKDDVFVAIKGYMDIFWLAVTARL